MDHPAQVANPSFFTTTSESISIMPPNRRLDHDAPSSLPVPEPYDMSMAQRHASNASLHQPSPPPSSESVLSSRISSAHHMGQSVSHGPLPSRPPTTASASLGVQLAQSGLIATQKLKRAFGGKRAKSVDFNKAAGEDSDYELARTHSRQGGAARQLTMQLASSMQALTGKKHRSSSSVHPPTSPLPPPVPPKPTSVKSTSSSEHGHETEEKTAGRRSSLQQSTSATLEGATGSAELKIALEPSSAHDAVASGTEPSAVVGDVAVPPPRRRERGDSARESEDWRKSDSTMRTVRLVGNRTPRPLSLAESTNSGHTVQASGTPPASRRLSALITDAEFIMPEVESEDESVQILTLPPADTDDEGFGAYIIRRSPPPSSKSHNRRSLSVQLSSLSPRGKPKFVEPPNQWSSDSEAFSTASTGTANSSTTSITSSPSHSDDVSAKDAFAVSIARQGDLTTSSVETSSNHSHSDGPWLTTTRGSTSSISLSTSTSSSKDLPPMPSSAHPDLLLSHHRGKRVASQPKGFRHTAVSLTSGLAPAAKGLGRKIGRAFAGSTSSISISSDHSHASSRKRDGNSGRWSPRPSIGTASSQSDTEGGPYAPVGPYLGQLVRGPKWHGGGLVFGRPLRDCVAETAIVTTDPTGGGMEERLRNSESESQLSELGVVEGARTTVILSSTVSSTGVAEIVNLQILEERQLPALALRCAQHLVKWGIQEEGLFRVNGRPAHITKIRHEFDSGADYDMSECGPGDIDPHAVASVFKAFLRELPEPLLTRNLSPYFEAAMSAENSLINASLSESSVHDRNLRGLRKPPSLSTLALPTLNVRKHSQPLLDMLANLISQLPIENRDLLKTVTELIRATAKRSKETKMPLSNLLLVFCPSLSMSPPLLRVLCEGEGIWDGPVEEIPAAEPWVQDIVLNIGPSSVKPTIVDDDIESKVVNNAEDDVYDGVEDSDTDDILQVTVRPRGSIKRVPISEIIVPDSSKPTTPTLHTPGSVDKSLPTLPHRDAGSSAETESQSTDLGTPPLTSSSTTTSSPNSAVLDDDCGQTEPATPCKPRMRKQSDLPSPFRSIRKSLISNPIPFPQTGSAPATPVGLKPTLTLTTSTSSPDLGPGPASATAASPGSGLLRRRTRPSLHDLLPKRSLSSLLSRPLSTFSIMDSPTAAAFTTAPQSRTTSDCPVLDLPVVHSPLKLEMDVDDPFLSGNATALNKFDIPDKAQAKEKKSSNETARLRIDMSETAMNRLSSTSSSSTTGFYTPLTQPLPLTPAPSLSAANSSDSYSLLDFKFKDAEKCEDDDWAKSVLLAAAADPDPRATANTAQTSS